MPQPPLLAFAPHKAPHFIHLGGINVPKDNVNLRRSKRVEQSLIYLFDCRRFFFEHVDDRGRADPQDTDDIPHATAIERHVDDLLFDRGQAPFVRVLSEENGARTVAIVAPVALRPIGLLSLLHHIDTLTRGTVHVHKSHRRSPFPLRKGGMLPI